MVSGWYPLVIPLRTCHALGFHAEPDVNPIQETPPMKDNAKPPKKILVLGPRKAGKTAISNYLGEQVDIDSLGDYRPTKGTQYK
ncbi:unnamed protein product [Nippostrongylus brasiliensis]|uniref:G domain-containing protein n=1 Tax=Nippostrongylus brasiliensis TaxID=27835 RepID=A0A0N4YYW1_NIPBR|nr:unnamed protein product [Nippostrongylus brasiliensis]